MTSSKKIESEAGAGCAHFFSKTARKPAEVIITTGPALTSGTVFQSYVASKSEARKHAKSYGAQCWNF